MRIVQEYNKVDAIDIIEATTAAYMGNYTIRILFSDGTEKVVDFKPFLSKSLHPSISKYLDENIFKQYIISNGNLNWNDYDLIFPIHDLYEGRIQTYESKHQQ